MTTQELKQYIDKVLGNNIRCLLPSYWWKRLFNQVADRIDDKQDILVSGKNIKTINGKELLGEGDTNADIIINSVDELNALGLPAGSRASVVTGGPLLSSIRDCVESEIPTQWTRISGVKIDSFPVLPEGIDEIALYFTSDGSRERKSYIIVLPTIMGAVDMSTNNIFLFSSNGKDINQSAVNRFNEYLQSGDYRLVLHEGYSEEFGDFFDSFIKFYIYHPTISDVYVKADSWEKLSKEYAVSSEEELNALSVENGTIARVVREIEPQAVKVSDCYLTNNTDNYANEWDKFTVIKKIEETDMNAESSNILYICALNESFTKDAIGVGYDNGVRCYIRIVDGVESPVSLDIVNDLLATGNYRLVIWVIAGRFDSYFTFYTEVAKDVSDAYIKGETWTRLLKEGDVTGGESSGKEDRVIYGFNTDLTAEQVESNKETYRLFSEGKASITILAGGVFFFTPNRYYHYNDSFVFVFVYDAYQCGIILNEDGTVEYESDLIVDSELSDTSENPVQNKAIKAYVDEKVANIGGTTIREFYTGDSLTAEQKAWNLETAQAILDKKAIVICNGSILGDGITMNNDGSKEFTNSAPTPQGVLYAGVKVEEDGTASIFFRQLYLDDKLSDKSISAVQNKAIKAYVDEKVANSGGGSSVDVDTELSNTSTNPVQNKVITNAINAKADNTKVDLISERLDDLESEMVTDADLDRAIASAITNTLNTEV